MGNAPPAPRKLDMMIERLQAYLREVGLDVGVGEAARGLGMSSRSLQRALGRLGTSFREVREQERMAKTLLSETDMKGEAISKRLGYSSAAQFTTFFRLRAGRPPSAWRSFNRAQSAVAASS